MLDGRGQNGTHARSSHLADPEQRLWKAGQLSGIRCACTARPAAVSAYVHLRPLLFSLQSGGRACVCRGIKGKSPAILFASTKLPETCGGPRPPLYPIGWTWALVNASHYPVKQFSASSSVLENSHAMPVKTHLSRAHAQLGALP